jgi:hypothetical protein
MSARCACGGRKDPRSTRCRSCAARLRWENGRSFRDAKRPLPAALCRCEHPLTDGDDECVRCGRLITPPDPDSPDSPVGACALSAVPPERVHVLPNVIHRVAA